jgi:hypothetical protein
MSIRPFATGGIHFLSIASIADSRLLIGLSVHRHCKQTHPELREHLFHLHTTSFRVVTVSYRRASDVQPPIIAKALPEESR